MNKKCYHCGCDITEHDQQQGWYFEREGSMFCSATCHALYVIERDSDTQMRLCRELGL